MARKYVKLIIVVVTIIATLLNMTSCCAAQEEKDPDRKIKKVFVLVGGTGDDPKNSNNLLKQSISGISLKDLYDEVIFISLSDENKAEKLNDIIASEDAEITVSAYSGGGKTVFYAPILSPNVKNVVLIDSITALPIADDGSVVNFWVQKAQDWVRNGKNVLILASNDDGIAARTNKCIEKILSAPLGFTEQTDGSLIDVKSGGTVSTVNVGGTHGQACVNSFSHLLNWLLKIDQ